MIATIKETGERSREPVRIFTHGGMAHPCEMWGTALAIVIESRKTHQSVIKVIRDNDFDKYHPIIGKDWFVDCGLKYDPDQLMFDHHQFTSEDPLCDMSSAGLISISFDHFKEALRRDRIFKEVIDRINIQDSYGGEHYANAVGLNLQIYRGMLFSERKDIRRFLSNPTGVAREYAQFVQDRILRYDEIGELADWVYEHGYTTGLERDIFMFDKDWPDNAKSNSGPAIQVAVKRVQTTTANSQICAIISKDNNRNTGCWTIYLPKIGKLKFDLNELKNKDYTVFVHNKGFLAVISPDRDPVSVLEMCRKSEISPISSN